MENDPNDPEYRKLVWNELRFQFDPDLLPRLKRSDGNPNPKFEEQKKMVVDAEIERRRISPTTTGCGWESP
jgi:hypothetical protein